MTETSSCDRCGHHQLTELQNIPVYESLVDLVRSGHFPLQEESDRTKRLIAEQGAFISKLEADVRDLQGKWETTQKALDTLKKSRTEYCGLVTPIRRLPAELLREVMIQSIDHAQEKRTRLAFRLAAVSHSWRQVALSTFELWKYVTLHKKITAELVEYQLSLTAPRTLHAIVMGYMDDPPEFDKPWGRLLYVELLLRFSERWRYISFVSTGSRSEEDLATSRAEFPALEAVCFRTPVLLNFEHSPLLSTVIWDTHQGPYLPTRTIPRHQITSLHLLSPMLHSRSYLRTIEKCPQLITLTFSGCSDANFDYRTTLQVHPCVSTLKLQLQLSPVVPAESQISSLVAFMKLASFPVLRTLTISRANPWPQVTIVPFIARSSQSLRTLILEDCHLTASEVIILLESLPSLSDLYIDGCPLGVDLLISGLRGTNIAPHPFLPSLEHLTLRNITPPLTLTQVHTLVNIFRCRCTLNGHSYTVDSLRHALNVIDLV